MSAKSRFLVSLGLSLAWPLSAHAQSDLPLLKRCQAYFSFLRKAPPRRSPPELTAKNRPRILVSGAGAIKSQLLADLDDTHVLLRDFRRPPETVLHFEETDRLGHFAYDDLDIHVPHWLAESSRAGKKLRKSVVQHEYGHAIFVANFGDFSPEWQAWYASASRRQAVGSLSRTLETPKPYALIELSKPYQELFADLLTVTAQHDPEAMAEPLSRVILGSRKSDGALFQLKVPRESAQARSFSAKGIDPDWSKAEIDAHHLFAPARRHLWKRYFSQERPFEETGAMLKKVFSVLGQQIMGRYENGAMKTIDPERLNQELIRALDEALAPYKLK